MFKCICGWDPGSEICSWAVGKRTELGLVKGGEGPASNGGEEEEQEPDRQLPRLNNVKPLKG